jgi:hypothetical protein
MNPRVEIERQKLRDQARKAPKGRAIAKLGDYDNVTGLTQAIQPNGGVTYGANLSNIAQSGDLMRVVQAPGGLAALDNLSISSAQIVRGVGSISSSSQNQAFPADDFSAFKGDIFNKQQTKKKKVVWELQGNAIYDGGSDFYSLTPNLAAAQVGGICNFSPIKNPQFNFTFEFRIFGSTTAYFADGLAFSYVPSVIGGIGAALGVGDIEFGFSCGIRTYFGEANAPMVKLFINSLAGFNESGSELSLRSSSWQLAEIQVNEDSLDINFGGVTLSAAIPAPPFDYFLRISAATATYNDLHEVRNLLFNGKPLRGI